MQVDYDQIAPSYDRHRSGDGPYLPFLRALAQEYRHARVLELGAGTGNTGACLAPELDTPLHCLEPAAGMIAEGRHKVPGTHWIRAKAEQLPFADDSYQFLYGVLFLQYIAEMRIFAAECARVIAKGTVALVTVPHDFIRTHPMNQFFPSFASIDLARFPEEHTVERALADAGFTETGCVRHKRDAVHLDAGYVQRISDRFISTYALLPEAEFNAGLRALRAAVESPKAPRIPVAWECVTVWGRKGA